MPNGKKAISDFWKIFSQAFSGEPWKKAYWQTPRERAQAERRKILEDWAKYRGLSPEFLGALTAPRPPEREVTMGARTPEAAGAMRLPEMPRLPAPEIRERRPAQERFLQEWILPSVGLAKVPAATTIRAAIPAKGLLPQVARGALLPLERVEQAIGAIPKVIGKGIKAPFRRGLPEKVAQKAIESEARLTGRPVEQVLAEAGRGIRMTLGEAPTAEEISLYTARALGIPTAREAVQPAKALLKPKGELPLPEAKIVQPKVGRPKIVAPEVADEAYIETLRDIPISQLTKPQQKDLAVRPLVERLQKINLKGVAADYKAKVEDLLKNLDIAFRKKETLDKRLNLRAHVAQLQEAGEEVTIPEAYLKMAEKTPLSDMTPRQLEELWQQAEHLAHIGRTKSKLLAIQANREIEQVTGELVNALQPIKTRLYDKYGAATFIFKTKEKIFNKWYAFTNRTYRVENILSKLDKYEDNGLFWRTFYEPLNKGTDEKLKGIYTTVEKFREFVKKNNLNINKFFTDKFEVSPEYTITPSQKIGVALSSLNKDNLRHIIQGNQITAQEIRTIIDSLTPEERKMAQWLHKYFQDAYKSINDVRMKLEGKPLGKVDNYFPIRSVGEAIEEVNFAKAILTEEATRLERLPAYARIPKSFLKERAKAAANKVDVDSLMMFLRYLEQTEHYKGLAMPVRDIQKLLSQKSLTEALTLKENPAFVPVMKEWLAQVAQANPRAITQWGEQTMRMLRGNAVQFALGLNLTTAMKQLPSWIGGMAETGIVPAIKGLFTYLENPKATGALIKQYSPQIWKRAFEREIAELALRQGFAKQLGFKFDPREVFMFMTVQMDRLVVRSLWRGAFDDFLSRNPGQMQAAADYGSRVIRRTQPFFDVKDLPELWRSNEFLRTLTTFTNQLNNYWNYTRFHIFGEVAAGKISKTETLRRIIEINLLPALLIGAVSRSRGAEDWRDLVQDVAGMGSAMVPILGQFMAPIIAGYRDAGGLITTEGLEKFGQAVGAIRDEDWKRAGISGAQAAAALRGIPGMQPMRTITGIADLVTGKTDDWLRLIWSEYAREGASEVNRARRNWKKDFNDYDAVSDWHPEPKIADKTRENMRNDNPELTAKLYIVGRISEKVVREHPQSDKVKEIVERLMAEYKIRQEDLPQEIRERELQRKIEDAKKRRGE